MLVIVARIHEGWNWADGMMLAGSIIIFLFALGLIAVSVVVMCVHIPKERDYQNALYEKQVLEYRLDHIEDSIVGSEMLYSEITDFNNRLRGCKYYSDSPWTGLFYNDKIAALDYIDITASMEHI